MSDRLRELLRQRALLQEHLAWLEQEIAAAAEKKPEDAATPAANDPRPITPSTPPAKPLSSSAGVAIVAKVISATGTTGANRELVPGADAIIDEFRVPPQTLESDVRRGCFLYFIAAFVLFTLGVAALYFTIGTR